MKLRSQTKIPAANSTPSISPVPSLPQHVPRLQTPPLSELSNAGSTMVRKDRFEDLSSSSSSTVDRSDTDPARNSTSPPPALTPKPTNIPVPAAPLTKGNLEKFQESATTSAADPASANELLPTSSSLPPTPTPPSPHTRLLQAKHFLEAEDTTSDPLFKTRVGQIDTYLSGLSQEQRERNVGVFRDVKGLVRDRGAEGGSRGVGEKGKVGRGEAWMGLGLGEGKYMPVEIREFEWERDGAGDVGGGSDAGAGGGDGAAREHSKAKRGNAPVQDEPTPLLLCAETPFLQLLMAEQIRADLGNGSVDPGTMGAKATMQFALPRPRGELRERAGEVAKGLNVEGFVDAGAGNGGGEGGR